MDIISAPVQSSRDNEGWIFIQSEASRDEGLDPSLSATNNRGRRRRRRRGRPKSERAKNEGQAERAEWKGSKE